MLYAAVGTVSWSVEDVVDATGADVQVDFGHDLLSDLRTLKTLMGDPEKGAWISATVTLTNDGTYRFDFNYERQVFDGFDRPPFAPPPAGEPTNPGEENWLAEFGRWPRRADLLPPWAPPADLIRTRRQLDERTRELREMSVPRPAALAPLAADREEETVLATVTDVVQARIGRQKYPDLLNPGQRDRCPAILAEPQRQCVAETFYWGRWKRCGCGSGRRRSCACPTHTGSAGRNG
ncbi:hypothetical protein [Nakamurella sp.]|uniref:hypothetical protein n=1 Tax=Nakamurella sp. TaxID=1869182 RepID=UPI003784D798